MSRAAVAASCLVLLALVGGTWAFRQSGRRRPPRRVHVVITPSSDPGGLDRSQREGLRQLVADHLELLGDFSPLEGLPPDATLPPETLRLQVRATYWDGQLRLEPAFEGQGAPKAARISAGTPDWAISDLGATLGVKASRPGLLRPEDPAACMEMMALLGQPILDDPGEPLRRYERLVARFPDCATAQYGFAGALYIASIMRPEERAGGQRRCEEAYRKAMALQPNMPRGIRTYSFFAADTGRGREALEASLACVQAFPHSPNAALSVAYPARISGLLELSERAMLRQARLTGLTRTMHTATDNTRLYRGDLPGFAASLDLPQAGSQSAMLDFYRGYARLLAGEREQALPFFLRSQDGDSAIPGFKPLSHIYALAVQDRPAEARRELEALARTRQRVQVLDGEFTFKVAELYGFLGQDKEALEYANRAATQGFMCLRWYESAPFLEGARKLPYWATLHRHLQERQARMETRFPVSLLES